MSEHDDHSGSRSRSPPATRASRTEGTDPRHTSGEAERNNHRLTSPFVGWRWGAPSSLAVPATNGATRPHASTASGPPVPTPALARGGFTPPGSFPWSMSDIMGGGTMFSIPPVEEMDTGGVTPSASFPGSVELFPMPKSKAASVAAMTTSTGPAETPEVNPSEPIVPNMPLLRVTLPTQLAFDIEMVVRNSPPS